MNRRYFSLAVTALSLTFASGGVAENWPCFRGPSHQGVSTERGLPLQWSATSNVLWKTAIPPLGWSSPIVWGDRVFLTTAPGDGKSLHLICLDRRTGAIAWDKAVLAQDPVRKDDGNSWATPTPVTDGARVYVVSFNGAFAAVDFQGAIVWTNLTTTFYVKHGLAASPLLAGEVLVMACDGTSTGPDPYVGWQKPWDGSYVLGLEKDTGKVRWKTSRGVSRVAFSTPNVAELEGRLRVISAAGDVVQCLDAQSGERIWTARNPGEGVVPSVVIGEGLVFAASGFNANQPSVVRAFRLAGQGEIAESDRVWDLPRGVPKVTSPVHARPWLFVVEETGVLQCLRAATGEVLSRKQLGTRHEPSPVLADGRLYLLSNNGKTTVFEAGPELKKLAENPLNEKCGASMAVSGGSLFIRTEHNLFCIGKGEPVAELPD